MASAPTSSPEELKRLLRVEQLRLLYDTQPFNVAATLTITAIIAVSFLHVADSFRIFLWCGVMLAGSVFRVSIALVWRRRSHPTQHLQAWWRCLMLASIVGGSGWGLCSILLFPVLGPSQQILLVFITSGVSAAAAVSLAADRYIAWGFLLPCTLPLELQFFRYADVFGSSLSLMGLLYLIFLIGVISRLHNYIRDNIALRISDSERERVQARFAQELRSSQEKLQALFDLSPLGCVLMRTDGELVEANPAFYRMLGYSIDELAQAFNVSLSTPERREEHRRHWAQLIKHSGTDSIECELTRKDGSLMSAALHRMVIDTGDGQHFVWALAEDITQRKQHEEQLQALNTRLSLATQAGKIGIWEVDLEHDGALWDARMCEIYGIEPIAGPIPQALAASLVQPDDWRRAVVAFEAAINDTSVRHHVFEYRLLRGDDGERWVRLAGLLQRDASGRVERIIGVGWDITELKRVGRMKSEFVSTVSHELRTPLTSIRGSLGLIASGAFGALPATVQELIDIAYKNSERLSLLIDDILDIEKIESGKMHLDLQRHALKSLIEQALAANQGFAQSFGVRLEMATVIDAAVVVDVHRFMQVMANLISNAVKFSAANEPVEIAAIEMQTRVRIEIRDRGPGVPAEFRERIYQHFSQADSSDTRARGGSGLGLAITKTLVEKMHGEIGFMDRASGGTIFFVEFPRQ